MAGPRNVLLIVVDQWRADFVPWLGAHFLRTPNLDRLCRQGVTFRNHVTTTVPCGPARASLLTGQYLMNHRAVQNTVPLDARHMNLGKALRRIGYDPALIGYTTTTPDPRGTGPRDPRFTYLGDLMEGFRSVGAFEPTMDGYFGWLAHKGYTAAGAAGGYLAAGRRGCRPRRHRPALPHPGRALRHRLFHRPGADLPQGRRRQALVPPPRLLPAAPALHRPSPYNRMYHPSEMPGPVRARRLAAEARQHPLLDFYLRGIGQGSFFQGAGGAATGLDDAAVRLMRATYAGLISEIDDNLGRVFDYLEQTGQWEDTMVVFTSDHGEQLGDH